MAMVLSLTENTCATTQAPGDQVACRDAVKGRFSALAKYSIVLYKVKNVNTPLHAAHTRSASASPSSSLSCAYVSGALQHAHEKRRAFRSATRPCRHDVHLRSHGLRPPAHRQ